jgi:hypothetical protein
MWRKLLLFCLFLVAAGAIEAGAQTANDLFDENVLHEVRLDMRPADWQFLKDHFREDTYVVCNFRWRFQNRIVDVPEIGCRNRGQGSRSAAKPGLRLQISHYDKDRTFLGLKTIILRNNTQDASMMHERVAMAFMRRMGLPAPRSTHTRLYVNGEYAGLYTITEEVDEVFVDRVFYGNSSGYLYKYDYAAGDPPHAFEYMGPDPARYVPKPFLPQTHEDDPQAGVIEAWWRTVNQASDADFVPAVAAYTDFANLLLEVGVEAYLSEQDGILGDFGLNNFLIYRAPGSNQFKFIPWDKSQTFFALDRSVYQNVEPNVMMRRLLSVPSMNAAFVDVLLNSVAAAGGAGGWLAQEITKEYTLIRTAALEDPYKQCYGGTQSIRPCSNEEFEAEAAYLMRFAEQRPAVVMRQLSSNPNAPGGTQPYSVASGGAAAFSTLGQTIAPATGYGRLQPIDEGSVPAGLAVYGLRQNGALVSETAAPAVAPFRRGRTYVQLSGRVRTGLSMVNANAEAAEVSFFFTDSSGVDVAGGNLFIPGGGQITAFLDEPPFGGTAAATTLTFTATLPVGVLALRGYLNERGEFLMSTQPVVNLDSPETKSIIPLFAAGGGWTTSVILVNPYDVPLTASILTSPAAGVATLPLTIPPRASRLVPVDPGGIEGRTGRIDIVAAGALAPSAFVVVSYQPGPVMVTEASIQAVQPAMAFRLYVESGGAGLQPALSIDLTVASAVDFQLMSLEGIVLGSSSLALTAGQRSFFLNELPGLQTLPSNYRGVLRISASAPLTVAALRTRINERNEFLISSSPAIAEGANPGSKEVIMPQLVDGGGYTTEVILYDASGTQPSLGVMKLFTANGSPFALRWTLEKQ